MDLTEHEKVGRNAPCPCGSGLKYKKCCLSKPAPTRFTREDRESAWAKPERFIERELDPEDAEADDEFWGRWLDRADEIDQDRRAMSEQVFDLWFAFDRRLDGGKLVVDRFLEKRMADLSPGERLYLQTMRESSMRLYEVEESRPGESLTLRDLIEDHRVSVQERLGSRSLGRYDWIAARVLAVGASGKPEIEGILPIPDLYHQVLRDQLRRERDEFLRIHPDAAVVTFHKTTPPLFQDVWAGALLEPAIPQLANTDGEEIVLTEVRFEVMDRDAVQRTFDAQEDLERDEDGGALWRWSGKNGKGEIVSLGQIKLTEQGLNLEANSVARGERGRELLERTAGAAVRYRTTVHQDLQRLVREEVRRGMNRDELPRPDAKPPIPPQVEEALVLDQQVRYYRSWLDESVPALDGQTPRSAAQDPTLRARLTELMHDLDRIYLRALKSNQPAFDPSWMWDELGLEEQGLPHPPPLAHERVAQLVPGSGELCRSIAEGRRRRPGFDDRSSLVTEEEVRSDLEVQRFLRQRPLVAGAEAMAGAPADLGPYLEPVINFELHRRKSFWVDEALAFMLAHTDVQVRGSELRLPFASFALVFTDRHVLSLAERLLARRPSDPLAGQYLRIATVFVSEGPETGNGPLRLCLAVDALGADLPSLITQEIPIAEDQGVEAFLESLAPALPVEPTVPSADPIRGLLQVTINAILYATSAGVEPATRPPPTDSAGRDRLRGGPPITHSSEEVFFLPGAIEISQVRRLQELERVPDGRTMLRRFMVRGHWRRPARGWTDQRIRWIQPHWKGPQIATVIERTYKLKQ